MVARLAGLRVLTGGPVNGEAMTIFPNLPLYAIPLQVAWCKQCAVNARCCHGRHACVCRLEHVCGSVPALQQGVTPPALCSRLELGEARVDCRAW